MEGCSIKRRILAGAAIVLLSSLLAGAAVAAPADGDYPQEDAKLSGRIIHTFKDGNETVTVVLDNFSLQIGKKTLSGRDAVLWVRDSKVGNAVRRDITAYIEGDAKVVEASGASTSDWKMLVTVRQEGDLTAKGELSDAELKDFPLYKRAVQARNAAEGKPADAATTQADNGEQPATQEETTETEEEQAPATQSAETQPQGAAAPAKAKTKTKSKRKVATATSTPASKPAGGKAIEHVNYTADKITSEEIGQAPNKRRVIVARGNVCLSRGNSSSAQFLELRSQAAVIFMEPSTRPSDKATPYQPNVSPMGGDKQREEVVGAYLMGDVIISRGERVMRGNEAYYDFQANRALVLDAVITTRQEQREIPVIIRAQEARQLSAREMYFKDARISTSEFYTPEYHIGAQTAYLMDTTKYDENGQKLSEQSARMDMKNVTFNVHGVPLLWWPESEGDVEREPTALRTIAIGRPSHLGWGVDTQWLLFRLLGLPTPEGFKGTADIGWHERGPTLGAKVEYHRDNYSGYSIINGMLDQDQKDRFGDQAKDIPAPEDRGRLLIRHKQLLTNDWQVQAELSYICDRNYLREFYPDEFYAGKEQETLMYIEKRPKEEKWAFDVLLQQRMNRFLTQTESAPDLGLRLIGQPLFNDSMTFFSESHAGMVRFRPDDGNDYLPSSDMMPRLDTREEAQLPVAIGPFKIVPYGTGRLTYWGDTPDGNDQFRPYGQVGLRATTHVWNVYDDVKSQLLDVNRLKHIITPYAMGFLADTNTEPNELFPMSPDMEQYLTRMSGAVVGVDQRLQTKRGAPGEQHTVDWMRLNVSASFYDHTENIFPSDGRFFLDRPEYSIGRNSINGEYVWNISDSTSFLADTDYDIDRGIFGRTDAGFVVVRDPRLRYYFGVRSIYDESSTVGTAGFTYNISRKYSVSVFEQYDFTYDNGKNMATSVTVTRKFARWFASFTVTFDQRDNMLSLYLTLWPEGIPEFHIGNGNVSSLLGNSSQN